MDDRRRKPDDRGQGNELRNADRLRRASRKGISPVESKKDLVLLLEIVELPDELEMEFILIDTSPPSGIAAVVNDADPPLAVIDAVKAGELDKNIEEVADKGIYILNSKVTSKTNIKAVKAAS